MKINFYILCSMIMLCLSHAMAQTWTPMEEPWGEGIYSMSIDKENNLYTGLNAIGAFKIDLNNKVFKEKILENYFVYATAITNNQTLILGTQYGICRRGENSPSWDFVNLYFANKQTHYLFKQKSGDILACLGNVSWAKDSGYVIRSVNDGKTWSVLLGVNYPLTKVCENSKGWLYASTQGGGIYCSKNNGIDWSQLLFHNDKKISGIYILKNDYLFVAVENGSTQLYLSKDDGNFFSLVFDEGLQFISSIFETDSGLLMSSLNIRGFYRSTDSGSSWIREDVPVDGGRSFAVDSSGNIYCGGQGKIYLSTDKGKQWIYYGNSGRNVFSVAQTKTGNRWVSCDYDLRYKKGSWLDDYYTQAFISNFNFYKIEKADDYIFINSASGYYRYNDITIDDLKELNIYGRDLKYCGNNTLIYTSGSGIYMSSNNGDSWTSFGNLIVRNGCTAIGRSNDGNIYLCFENGIIKKTSNIGTLLNDITYNLSKIGYITTIFVTTKGDILIGTKNNGIYKLPANSSLWEELSIGLTNLSINGIESSDDGSIFAYTAGGGIFLLSNSQEWIPKNDGLFNLNINDIEFDPNGYVYAATAGSGIYKADYTLLDVNENAQIENPISISPNPATDFIEITVGAQRAVPDAVSIFDILGMEVLKSMDSRFRENDSHFSEGNIRIDVSNLAPGVYFVRVGDVVKKFVKI